MRIDDRCRGGENRIIWRIKRNHRISPCLRFFAAICESNAGRRGVVCAVNGLDIAINKGECFGLLGPNGAGKTTTIEIFEGLLVSCLRSSSHSLPIYATNFGDITLAPTCGELQILGMHWGESDDELRQKIGISLQKTRFTEWLTVFETVQSERLKHA
jgi:ABC-type multidrug transport system ATPase subunit